jgi:hypothetical protein
VGFFTPAEGKHQVERTEYGERIAVLEASHDDLKEQLTGLQAGQKQILDELTKYKGAIGFGAFLVSGLFSVLILAKDWIAAHIK